MLLTSSALVTLFHRLLLFLFLLLLLHFCYLLIWCMELGQRALSASSSLGLRCLHLGGIGLGVLVSCKSSSPLLVRLTNQYFLTSCLGTDCSIIFWDRYPLHFTFSTLTILSLICFSHKKRICSREKQPNG